MPTLLQIRFPHPGKISSATVKYLGRIYGKERRNRKRNIKKKVFIASLNRWIQLSMRPHSLGSEIRHTWYSHMIYITEKRNQGQGVCVWFRFGYVWSGLMGCFRLSPLLPWSSKQLSWRQGPQGDQGVRGQCFWQGMKQDSAKSGKGPVHKFLPTGRFTNNKNRERFSIKCGIF